MAGVIVVFPKPEDSKSIKNLLIHNGYDNVFSCATGSKAITLADTLGEGVIYVDIECRICHILISIIM